MDGDMRRALNFSCAGASLAATLDMADGAAGLLIVSGGNEIRCGAHRGMAMLAAELAALGHPVFRFDRRGIGDSEGANGGYLSSRDDLIAAIAAFREACPAMGRVVGFGNCDAATALALHQPLELDALVLGNPWTIDAPAEQNDPAEGGAQSDHPALPPAGAIRARYLARLRDPESLKRLLRGDINLGKLARGIGKMLRHSPVEEPNSLGTRLMSAMGELPVPADILLASGDRTAQAFAEHWSRAKVSTKANGLITELDSNSHSFASEDAVWLRDRLLEILRR